jgi:hypothetical protein
MLVIGVVGAVIVALAAGGLALRGDGSTDSGETGTASAARATTAARNDAAAERAQDESSENDASGKAKKDDDGKDEDDSAGRSERRGESDGDKNDPSEGSGPSQGSATTVGSGEPGSASTTAPAAEPEPPSAEDLKLEAAYVAGYTDRCNEIWSHAAADGMLWDALEPEEYGPFNVDDCLTDLAQGWGYLYSSEAEAYSAGTDDANWIAASLVVNERFRNSNGDLYALP